MIEGFSIEKRRAMVSSEAERGLQDLVEGSGLKENTKMKINKRLLDLKKDNFSWGASKIFLDWLFDEKSKTKNNLEAQRLNNLYVEIRESLRDYRIENN